jgi:NIMA-interacting peptidyl-prolyl cis-trans isomerase 1
VHCSFGGQQQRDLAVLFAKATYSLQQEASFESKCRVWEGEGYGDYYGLIYGNVMMLYEGAEPPSEGTEPTEALMLHGCKAEAVDAEGEEEDGPELSLSDSGGEIFSLCLTDEAACDEWKEAIEGRNAPPAIARASHILIKHSGSRRVASWRDPTGREIGSRSKAEAVKMLKEFKRLIENGSEDLSELAKQVSDCDTAQHGGDLGWFAANYMQPEFEEAVLGLDEGQLSGIVETASGVHLIMRTG